MASTFMRNMREKHGAKRGPRKATTKELAKRQHDFTAKINATTDVGDLLRMHRTVYEMYTLRRPRWCVLSPQ